MSSGFTKRESTEDATALERLAHQLEQDGQDFQAIRHMEKALLIRSRDFANDPACIAACERLVVKCNSVAVAAFKNDDYQTAVALLEDALRLTDESRQPLNNAEELRLKLRGTTLNNLGCLERRRGRLQVSLRYLSMSVDFAGQQSPATYLNISAIQSQLGMHEEAVGSARRAIGLLESSGDSSGLVAIAQHNLAMALESLDPARSLVAYEAAKTLAQKFFGPGSATTSSIEVNLQRFLQKNKVPKQLTLPPIAPDKPRVLVPHPFSMSKKTEEPSPERKPRNQVPKVGAPAPPPPRTSEQAPRKRDALKPHPPALKVDPSSQASVKPKRVERKMAENQKAETIVPEKGNETKSEPPVSTKSPPVTAIAPTTEAQEPLHKSDDLVGFMVNRLNLLLTSEDKFEQMFSQVVKIQSMYRCFSSRKKLKEKRVLRQRSLKLQEIVSRSAARKIQQFLRRAVLVQRMRNAVVASKQRDNVLRSSAANKIQKLARSWIARRVTRRLRSVKRSASAAIITLQCWFRKTLARRLRISLRDAQTNHLIVALRKEKEHRAVSRIQRAYRVHRAQTQTKEKRMFAKAAREEQRLVRQNCGAVRIQAWWRGITSRRSYCIRLGNAAAHVGKLREVERRRCSARVIQGFARGIIDRRRVGPLLDDRRLKSRLAKSEKLSKAAVRIQSFARMILAKTQVSRLKQQNAASRRSRRMFFLLQRIQSVGRGFVCRVLCVSKVSFKAPTVHNVAPPKVEEHLEIIAKEVEADVQEEVVEPFNEVAESHHESVEPNVQVKAVVEPLKEADGACHTNDTLLLQKSDVVVTNESHSNAPEVTVKSEPVVEHESSHEQSEEPIIPQRTVEHPSGEHTVMQRFSVNKPHKVKRPVTLFDEDLDVKLVAKLATTSETHRFTALQKSAGAKLVRVGRGFLARKFAKQIQCIISEYLGSLAERDRDSPSKRRLEFTLLEKIENDKDVIAKRDETLTKLSHDAAATRIQCNFRVLLAKRQTMILREERRQWWESRRDVDE